MARFVHAVVGLCVLAALYTTYRHAAQPWYLERTGGLAPLLNEDALARMPGVYIVVLLPGRSLHVHTATLREAHVDITGSIRPGVGLLGRFPWYSAALDDGALTIVRQQDDVAWVECNIAVPMPKVEQGELSTEPLPDLLTLEAEGEYKVVAQKSWWWWSAKASD